jgi:AsmA protein
MVWAMTTRRILWIGGGIVALAVLLAALVPYLVPTGGLKDQIERQAAERTGRAFHIDGGVSFTVFPDIGLEARDVHLANAPGGHAADLLRVGSMRIAVRLLPLFSGRIEVRKIVLDRPTIALEVAPDGHANWTLPARPGSPGRGRSGLPSDTQFAGLEIRHAALTYANDRLGTHRAVGDLDADVNLTRLNAATGLSGTFAYNGRTIRYVVAISTLDDLLTGRTTRTNVALNADFLNVLFDGTVTRDGVVAGTLSLKTPSIKDLAAWLGHPVRAGAGLGPLDLTADVTEKDRIATLGRIAATIDGMHVAGNLEADHSADVPIIHGRLDFDRLDLNTYLNSASASGPRPAPAQAPDEGWSTAPIRLGLLKLADGQLVLNAGSLSVLHMRLGKTSIALSLDGGAMTAHINPMALYGGSGSADLTVDARGPVPQFRNRLAFRGIAMAPFLADTIGNDKIDGRGDIILDVTATGRSPNEVMRSLTGRGSVAIGAGRITGVDLGGVARTIVTILSAGAVQDSATTPFDRFAGTFAIANGVLSNDDLKLSSAFLNMSGRGRLDLGNRTIDYRIEPKASLGGRLNLLEVGVPFNITGSWRHVHYRPDVGAAVGGLVTGVLGVGPDQVGRIVDGLSGGDRPPQNAPNDKKKKHKSVGDALKNMFGIH